MRRIRSRRRGAGVLATTAVVALCGSCATSGGAASSGPVTVFAAASLTESFEDLRAVAGVPVTYSFAGSGTVVAQVLDGAPADVVATADPVSMATLRDAGLVEPPVTFATNRLEILVRRGNPKGIRGLQDLARRDLRLVLADDTVPAGRYAATVLAAAGVTVRPVSRETDVRSAVARVTSGEADATVVYVTDVIAAGERGQGIPIPASLNVVAEYRIALVASTRRRAAAQAFIAAVLSPDGQEVLRARGFGPAA